MMGFIERIIASTIRICNANDDTF